MDGRDALLNEAQKECEYRNEPACAGLQHETNDEHNGDDWVNGSYQAIGRHIS